MPKSKTITHEFVLEGEDLEMFEAIKKEWGIEDDGETSPSSKLAFMLVLIELKNLTPLSQLSSATIYDEHRLFV